MSLKKKKQLDAQVVEARRQHRRKSLIMIKRNWLLYLVLLPAVLYIATFCYAPMYGLQIAFRNFRIADGIVGSEWAGLKWFNRFFNTPRFWLILKNTLTISLYSLAVSFPLPIALALILNNVRNAKYKKFAQTITYMPHFISTVVLVGMMSVFFSPRSGVVNTVLGLLGIEPIYFMGTPEYFSHMYAWSGVWQTMGWNSIIYMAALAGVDPSLHEAAMIDGANKIKRVIHIDLPTIVPTISILLIMNFGKVMSVGYEKVYLMQNDLNASTSEIISTYVYKMGVLNQQYSYSTAINLFNNVINFLLVVTMNKVVKKLSGSGLW
ncbi:MAG: sugar ABC transporter permease [Lachnospiraceae bacterium]|nr:sugar ABC transporter permease [Lachnospiraceae bacterium]